ncbi:MAG: glycosyltransferase [Planctomycetota bacterium]
MNDAPRVSVLIPNYNNGRASSSDGRTDLIGDLLASLRETLRGDPTPFEVIAYDDGSTDDSLETLRRWADDGFLRLIEDEHRGVLARTANRLVAASRGEILVRLDGDITVLTSGWVSKLCSVFDQGPPDLGVVGPKQLTPDGQWVHSFGDFVLHPKGYVHLHQGQPRHAVTRAAEVDHVMGCFYCCRRSVHDELGGYDEDILRGQTVDFGLRARRAGYRCFAVPHIEFVHRHSLRGERANVADTSAGIDRSRAAFLDKWGFDRLAVDLDVVRERYAGSPLLWNATVFGTPGIEVAGGASGGSVDASSWKAYASNEDTRRQIDFRVNVVKQLAEGRSGPVRVAVIGVGDGLLAHLLASAGMEVVGCEADAGKLALAEPFMGPQRYPGERPGLVHQTDPRRLPWGDNSADVVVWPGGIESHGNPVALLREAPRVMDRGGVFAVVTPQQEHAAAQGVAGLPGGYLAHELAMQVRAAVEWTVPTPQTPTNPKQPLVVLAAAEPAVFTAPRPAAA